MADYFVNPGGPGFSGSIIFRIDNNNDETNRRFLIEHDGGGGGKELFEVFESGKVNVHGTLVRQGVHRVEKRTPGGDVASFESQANVVAKVTSAGVGVFFGGINLHRDLGANDPDTAGLAGVTGQVILWHNAGTGLDEVWACNDGATSSWNRATQ